MMAIFRVSWYSLPARTVHKIGIIQTTVHLVNGRCGYALRRGPPLSPCSDTDLCRLHTGQNAQHLSISIFLHL